MNVLPIINENDSVVTDELEEELFGQNDLLSAMVAELVGADLLIILSDVEGLYDKDPNINENAKLIKLITKIDDEILKGAEGTVTDVGTGGMKTKVQAAKYAMDHGIETIFAAGNDMRVLYQILEGEDIGTFFCVINQDNNIKCK
jgi:glutamate 5-kinase